MSAYANRVPFGKDMRRDYTIVAPQMSPIHFRLVEAAIRKPAPAPSRTGKAPP